MTIRIEPFGLWIIHDNGSVEFIAFCESVNPIYEVSL